MKFRTEIPPLEMAGFIDHTHNIALIGSCFTSEVGARLSDDGFNVLINPFGPVYNPASIDRLIRRISLNIPFTEADDVFRDGLHHTLWSHTALSRTSLSEMLQVHNDALAAAKAFLTSADRVILTLGSARVFRAIPSGHPVVNCHKLPASAFEETLLSPTDVATAIISTVATLRSLSPGVEIILTVSPIRHKGAGGLHANQLSKSSLLLGIDKAIAQTPQLHYFPSYEIVLDDLRDYRFYNADLCHPSQMAVDYVYSIFSQSYFTDETQRLAAKCRDIARRISHRPINPDSYAQFAAETDDMIRRLLQQHPCLEHKFQSITQ